MWFRLKLGNFQPGGGGTETPDFTAQTVPRLVRAQLVTARNAGVVAGDYPNADVADVPELLTIAALRSAIELENSVENADHDRIREWREQLREFVARVDGSAGGGHDENASQLKAAWYFPPRVRDHVPGSEYPHPWFKTGNTPDPDAD